MTLALQPDMRRVRGFEARAFRSIKANQSPTKTLRYLLRDAIDQESQLRLFRLTQSMVREYPLNFAVCACFLTVAQMLDRFEAAERLVEHRRANSGVPGRWDSEHFLGHFVKPGDVGAAMTRFKYDVQRLPNDQTLLELAERIAPRVNISDVLLDRLFSARSDTTLSREAWEPRIKRAFALDHIVQDQYFLDLDVEQRVFPHFDMVAYHRIVADVAANKPVVLITLHSGLLSLTRALYGLQDDWVTIQSHDTFRPNAIAVSGDTRTAFFAAYREAQKGRSLVFAPDGGRGNLSETIEVLGTQSSAGGGAAFIAYELRTPVWWINVVREGDILVPVLVEGPRRMDGESFGDFKLRFNQFYGGQIESLFTGNPDSIALRQRWSYLLETQGEG